MGRVIVKLDDDKFIEWSSVVDAPVSAWLTRTAAAARWGEDRVARADCNGHSARDMKPCPPGEASAPGNPHGGHDMYELTIRIPMAAFTGAPNADPRLDRLVDLAMGLFPGTDATGAPAWLEDGPPPCPTCGATDRAERRHRAHADAEATLRDLVRWLARQRDRAHDRRYDDYGLILGYLRDQGLDVDYLAQPPTSKETP